MWAIHSILVHIPTATESALKEKGALTKAQIKDCVIQYALDETLDFSDEVYDCRTYIEDEEGNPLVIFAEDDWKAFEDDLVRVDTAQQNAAKNLLNQIKKLVGSTDLSDLLQAHKAASLSNRVKMGAKDSSYVNLLGYFLKQFASLIHGDYFFDSMFYDTYNYTSLVPEIGKLKKSPKDWAIVQFDCHN